MRILTLYSTPDAGLFRVWERSWRLRGWKPGIITPKEIQKHPSARAAARARGSGLLCTPRLINYAFKRPRSTPDRLPRKKFGAPGWEKAPVVLFPEGFTEADILNCGRPL